MTPGQAVTERILRIASRRRMFQSTLAELSGIPRERFYDRVRHGNWTDDELCDIAIALNERVEMLLDVSEVL